MTTNDDDITFDTAQISQEITINVLNRGPIQWHDESKMTPDERREHRAHSHHMHANRRRLARSAGERR